MKKLMKCGLALLVATSLIIGNTETIRSFAFSFDEGLMLEEVKSEQMQEEEEEQLQEEVFSSFKMADARSTGNAAISDVSVNVTSEGKITDGKVVAVKFNYTFNSDQIAVLATAGYSIQLPSQLKIQDDDMVEYPFAGGDKLVFTASKTGNTFTIKYDQNGAAAPSTITTAQGAIGAVFHPSNPYASPETVTFAGGGWSKDVGIDFEKTKVPFSMTKNRTKDDNLYKWTVSVTPGNEDTYKGALVLKDILQEYQLEESKGVTFAGQPMTNSGGLQAGSYTYENVSAGNAGAPEKNQLTCVIGDFFQNPDTYAVNGKYDLVFYTRLSPTAVNRLDDNGQIATSSIASGAYCDTSASGGTINEGIDTGKTASNTDKVKPKLISYSYKVDETNPRRLIWTLKINTEGINMYNTVLKIDAVDTNYHLLDSTTSNVTVTGSTSTHYDYTNDHIYIGENGSGTNGNWNINNERVITFYSDIQDEFYKENISNYLFKIDASLSWAYEQYGTNGSPINGAWDGNLEQPIMNNSIIKKSGEYIPKDGTILWSITVNESKNALSNVTVEDTIGANQELIGVYKDKETQKPLTTTQGDSDYYKNDGIATGSKVTIYAKDCNKKAVTYYVKTKIVDETYRKENVYINTNNGKELANNIELKGSFNGQEFSKRTSASVKIKSDLLQKTGNYKRETYRFHWKATVNTNKMELTNAVLKDTIAAGTKYVDGTMTAKDSSGGTVTVGVSKESNGDLTLNVGNISDTITLEYDTVITDFERFNQNSGSTKSRVSNTICLTSNETAVNGVTVTANVDFDIKIIQKEAVNLKKNYQTWKVIVNEDYISGNGGYVTDTITAALKSDGSAISMTVDASLMTLTANKSAGAPDENVEIGYGAATESKAGYSFDEATGEFKVTFPTGTAYDTAKYTLIYTTKPKTVPTSTYKVKNGASYVVNRNGTNGISNGATAEHEITVIAGSGEEVLAGTVKLTVINKDSATENVIQGAKFELVNKFQQVVGEGTADADGKVVFTDLAQNGEYTIRHKVPADNYLYMSDNNEIERTITMGTTDKEETMKSQVIAKDVTFRKTGEVFDTGAYEGLGNVVFSLYPVQNGVAETTPKANVTSQPDGTVKFEGLTVGEYIIRETSAPDQYQINTKDIVVKITRSADYKTASMTVTGLENDNTLKNDLKKQGITVVLKNRNGDTLPIPNGVTLKLFDNGIGKEIKRVTTSEHSLVFESVPSGSFTVSPVEDLKVRGYKLDTTDNSEYQGIVHQADTATTVTIYYVPDLCDITVNLVDKNDTSKKLEAGKFQLKDDEGKIYEGVTNADGTVVFKECISNVPYTLVQTEAPDEYLIDTTEYQFTPTADYETTIKNEVVKVGISFTKLGEIYQKGVSSYEALDGATFKLYQSNEAYEKGTEIATAVSGKDGKVVFEPQKSGYYLVEEVGAPKQYDLTQTKQIKIKIGRSADASEAVIEFAGDIADKKVKNDLLKSDIKIVMKDDKGNKIEIPDGTKFELLAEDGTTVITTIEARDGMLVFENVPYGNYYVRRVSDVQIPGYVILHGKEGNVAREDVFKVAHQDITEENKTAQDQELELLCKTAKSRIKVSIRNGETPLPNVEVALLDKDGNVYRTGITDENGEYIWENLPEGTYFVVRYNSATETIEGTEKLEIALKEGAEYQGEIVLGDKDSLKTPEDTSTSGNNTTVKNAAKTGDDTFGIEMYAGLAGVAGLIAFAAMKNMRKKVK